MRPGPDAAPQNMDPIFFSVIFLSFPFSDLNQRIKTHGKGPVLADPGSVRSVFGIEGRRPDSRPLGNRDRRAVLSHLGDPRTVPTLEAAAAREDYELLRANMLELVEQLKGSQR